MAGDSRRPWTALRTNPRHLSRGKGTLPMKHESSKRGGKAIRALQKAARYASMEPQRGAVDVILNRMEVERAEAVADAMLKPTGELVAAAGEVVHLDPADLEMPRLLFADTIRAPNMIAVDASEQRLEAAADAGVLEAAVDAAESARAGNSLEKMLCHQMAAAHHTAMKLMARGTDTRLPPVEVARLTNAAARLMQVYQEALLALFKIRPGGKQVVVVQHVEVSGRGQAVIAGNMKAGGGGQRDGGGREND